MGHEHLSFDHYFLCVAALFLLRYLAEVLALLITMPTASPSAGGGWDFSQVWTFPEDKGIPGIMQGAPLYCVSLPLLTLPCCAAAVRVPCVQHPSLKHVCFPSLEQLDRVNAIITLFYKRQN